jgi:hypothetical protein
MNMKPSAMPSTGATKMKVPIFRMPLITKDSGPPCTRAAPAKPPSRAWEELDGRPRHQVMRFHAIAPTRPAVITGSAIAPGCTTPLPIVFATCRPKKNTAMKLKNAAQITALRGVSTRVDTTVAIEFAPSWKRLM